MAPQPWEAERLMAVEEEHVCFGVERKEEAVWLRTGRFQTDLTLCRRIRCRKKAKFH